MLGAVASVQAILGVVILTGLGSVAIATFLSFSICQSNGIWPHEESQLIYLATVTMVCLFAALIIRRWIREIAQISIGLLTLLFIGSLVAGFLTLGMGLVGFDVRY